MPETETIDFFEVSEKIEPTKSSSVNYKTTLPKLILGDNDVKHGMALVDFLRSIKLARHWNDETKKMDLCEKHYKKECVGKGKCAPPKGSKEKGSAPTITRFLPFFCLERVGSLKDKEDGTQYEEEPVVLAEIRSGENQNNFKTLQEANNGHPDFADPYDFYKKEGDQFVLDKSTLINCQLMYNENGEDKVWQLTKSVSGTGEKKKVSYPPPKEITSRAKLKQNLGPQVSLRVPKNIREIADSWSAKDVLRMALVHSGNVRWEEFGLTPPTEEDKPDFGSFATPKEKVDAGKEL